MRFRFTLDDARHRSDRWLLAALCEERRSDLNPYTPFAERLKALADKLRTGAPLTREKK